MSKVESVESSKHPETGEHALEVSRDGVNYTVGQGNPTYDAVMAGKQLQNNGGCLPAIIGMFRPRSGRKGSDKQG